MVFRAAEQQAGSQGANAALTLVQANRACRLWPIFKSRADSRVISDASGLQTLSSMSESIPSVGPGSIGRYAIMRCGDLTSTSEPSRREAQLDDGFRGLGDYSKVRVSEGGQITLVSPAGQCLRLSVDHFGCGEDDITSHEAGRLLQGTNDGETVLQRLAGIDVAGTKVRDAACIYALLNRAETSGLTLADVALAYEQVSAVYRRAVDDVPSGSEQQAVACEEAAVVAMQAAQSYTEAKMPDMAAKLYAQMAQAYRRLASLIGDGTIDVQGDRQEWAYKASAMAKGASELEYEQCLCAFDERPVPKDGDCLFTALKESAGLEKSTSALRCLVAEELELNSAHYVSFFDGDDPAALLRATASALRRDGQWINCDVAPQLMPAVLRRAIRIVDTHNKITEHLLPPEGNFDLNPITIFYNAKDHYNAAIRKPMNASNSEAMTGFSAAGRARLTGHEDGVAGAERIAASVPYDLTRFVSAQDASRYEKALQELRDVKKRTHWMWYMFPQFQGLGSSEQARRFAIHSPHEAAAYLAHPVLGARITKMARAVSESAARSIEEIFSDVDAEKFHASMTLFATVAPSNNPVFTDALQKYFGGSRHQPTLNLLNSTARSTGLP